MKLTPGDILDQKYQIVRILGTGGMGSVYEATNVRLGRRVAIKIMHKVRDQGDIARFEREARAAQIGSPYIVQVNDLGYTSDGAPYMVMEYLAGESLGERVHRQGRLRPSELIPIVKQVLEALAAAHRAGIVHRDLKPDNVFLSRPEGESREVVKLVDFGISKLLGNSSQGDALSLTKTGVAVGTPHYMSPEQVQGRKELDGRSDLYSLGVMIYRCLSGQLPFNSDEIAPLLMQILVEVPRPLRELAPELDRELITIVTRAMARRAEDRFQTANDFLNVLTAWEKSHAADLDAPLVPAGMTAATKTGALGTAASWSSVTDTPVTPGSRFRTTALTVSFLVAGVVGVLVAFKLWTTPRAPVDPVASASASAVVSPITANEGIPGEVAGSASGLSTSRAPAVAPVGAQPFPTLVRGVRVNAGNHGGSPAPEGAGAVALVPAPVLAPSTAAPLVTAAPPVVTAPVAVTPAPAAAPPAAPAKPHNPPAGGVDPSNRHVLGDL